MVWDAQLFHNCMEHKVLEISYENVQAKHLGYDEMQLVRL